MDTTLYVKRLDPRAQLPAGTVFDDALFGNHQRQTAIGDKLHVDDTRGLYYRGVE